MAVALGARAAQAPGADAVRAGTGEFPALSPGAGQPPAEGSVRLRAEEILGRGVRVLPGCARASGQFVTQRDFAGKVVLITGAAGGLGQALARAFAADGARIAALDRDAAGVETLAAELRSQGR